MKQLVVGIDIGGTRTKLGILDLNTYKLSDVIIFDTNKNSEDEFLTSIDNALIQCLKENNYKIEDIFGAGLSIGSYVFADGSIDGMSSFVPFMVEGWPLKQLMEDKIGLPVRADNDARLIGLAETRHGIGKGYNRTLTMTIGTGIGIGVCVDGKPLGDEAFFHLAGHIKVRTGNDIPCLDIDPCYCGLKGCFESSCSGSSLEKYLNCIYEEDITNEQFFELAQEGDEEAKKHLKWYLDLLCEALNQYIYIYCPDIIILGGGISTGLKPWEEYIVSQLKAKVHYRHNIILKISSLMEDSGVLGAASLFEIETNNYVN